MRRQFTDTCVVIPVYNEGSVIGDVLAALKPYFPNVVCVDDGSTDNSAEVCLRSGARVVSHGTNLGQGAALQTGLQFGLGLRGVTWFVTFDADGQHRASDAVDMVLAARESDVDVILGTRFQRGRAESVPHARRALLTAATAFTRATTGLQLTDSHNGLRVLSRSAAEQVDLRMHGASHASELLTQVARQRIKYLEHPITVDYTDYSKAKGQRGYNAFNIVFDLAVSRLRSLA